MLAIASLFEDPIVVFLIGLSLLVLFFWYFVVGIWPVLYILVYLS